MTTQSTDATDSGMNLNTGRRESFSAYDRWLVAQDVPVHTGYYVEDVRKVERGWWSLRGCPAAVVNLVGHQGVTEAHVIEVPPGETIPEFRMAIEEVVYVLEGQGIATVWGEGKPKVTFEFGKHALFRIPANYYYQLSNARGDQSTLTLHMSYLPLAMTTNSNPDFYFNNASYDASEMYDEEGGFYSNEAKAIMHNGRMQWHGNFFPDLTLWDNLTSYGGPGRMAYRGGIVFPNSSHRPGLMVLPSRRYRAAHRHGPGVSIIGIQEAQGLVIMWPEGGEKIVVPWQEGALFVPPNMWYHMHINTGSVENRQLRVFPPRPIMNYSFEDANQMIPFVDEEPWIKKMFEDELEKNGLTSLMPEEAFTDPNFEWSEAFLEKE